MNRLTRSLGALGAAVFAALCLTPAVAKAASICLSGTASGNCSAPSTTTATVSADASFFDVYLLIDGAQNLHGWNLTELDWDSSVINLQDVSAFPSVTAGSFLSNNGAPCVSTPCSTQFGGGDASAAGKLSAAFGQLDDPNAEASGTGVLAILRFVPIAAGTSPITFVSFSGDPADVNDPLVGSFLLSASTADFLSYTTTSGSVEVTRPTTTPVPEPASIFLFVGGLIGIAQHHRRVKAS